MPGPDPSGLGAHAADLVTGRMRHTAIAQEEAIMKTIRMILALTVASMLVVAPIGSVQANDAHHPGAGAATKQSPAAKKKVKTLKNSVGSQKQSSLGAPLVKESLSVTYT
jgi:hypothetical protein